MFQELQQNLWTLPKRICMSVRAEKRQADGQLLPSIDTVTIVRASAKPEKYTIRFILSFRKGLP